jgi:hypothetical protein
MTLPYLVSLCVSELGRNLSASRSFRPLANLVQSPAQKGDKQGRHKCPDDVLDGLVLGLLPAPRRVEFGAAQVIVARAIFARAV